MKAFFVFSVLAVLAATINAEKAWWQTMSLYQIYPRSFKDSDGDGIGDLKGIYEKLEHLKDAGVDAFWLSPVFPSPMVDMGYDISNFIDIEPTFGTLKDFDVLLEKAHEMGLKVLMDFVPNHSSDKHEWFQKSVKNIKPYDTFYTWANGTVLDDGTRVAPNNWVSVFGGSAWEWNDERQAYYLHQFAIEQPDLNYRNVEVVREMKNVLRFWLNKGVDGFRIDAIPHLFEDELLRDEPPSGDSDDPKDYYYYKHSYTKDLPETYDMVREWREVVDEFEDRIMVMEAYSSTELTMKYYDYGSNFPFNFWFINRLTKESTAQEFKETIDEWMTNMPEGGTANWVAGNHDQKRLVTRYGPERANAVLAIVHLLPGVSVTYNGEEIGMPDNYVSWEETTDPQGCNAGIEGFADKSRDPARTPFLWDDTTSAGFSTNPKTWLPVNPDYKELNLEVQKNAEDSIYKFYQALSALRRWPAVREGELKTHAFSDSVFSFSRTMQGEKSVFVVTNLASERQTADLSVFGDLPSEIVIYRATLGSGLNYGDKIDPRNVQLPALGAVIYVTPETL